MCDPAEAAVHGPLFGKSLITSTSCAKTQETREESESVSLRILSQPVPYVRFIDDHQKQRSQHSFKFCSRVKLCRKRFSNVCCVTASLYTAHFTPHVNTFCTTDSTNIASIELALDENGIAVLPSISIVRPNNFDDVPDLLYLSYLKQKEALGIELTDDLKASLRARAADETPKMKDHMNTVRIGFRPCPDHTQDAEANDVAFTKPISDWSRADHDDSPMTIVDVSAATLKMSGCRLWIQIAGKLAKETTTVKFESSVSEFSVDVPPTEVIAQQVIVVDTPDLTDHHELNTVLVYLVNTERNLTGRPTELAVEGIDGSTSASVSSSPCSDQPMTTDHQARVNSLCEYARSGDISHLMLDGDAERLRETDAHRNNPLMIAAEHGHASVVQCFLKLLTDDALAIVNAQNHSGQTALHLAIRGGHVTCVHYLLSTRASRNIADCDGNTALHALANVDSDDIIRDVLCPPGGAEDDADVDLDGFNKEGQTALHLSAHARRLTLVDALLQSGAQSSTPRRTDGWTALHLAAAAGDVQMVQGLIESGVEINAQAFDGSTALHMAVLHDAPLVLLARLMQAGADLQCTCARVKGDVDETVVESVDSPSNTVLDLASDNDEMLKLLKSNAEHWHTVVQNYENEQAQQKKAKAETRVYPDYASEKVVNYDADWSDRPSTSSASPLRPYYWTNLPCTSVEQAVERTALRAQEDISNLDFLTRLRIAKRLDHDGAWKRLAEALSCSDMVEPIEAVTDSSPTLLLMDQYEQMVASSLSALLLALEVIGFADLANSTVEDANIGADATALYQRVAETLNRPMPKLAHEDEGSEDEEK